MAPPVLPPTDDASTGIKDEVEDLWDPNGLDKDYLEDLQAAIEEPVGGLGEDQAEASQPGKGAEPGGPGEDRAETDTLDDDEVPADGLGWGEDCLGEGKAEGEALPVEVVGEEASDSDVWSPTTIYRQEPSLSRSPPLGATPLPPWPTGLAAYREAGLPEHASSSEDAGAASPPRLEDIP